ncbi:MAG: alpha/beta fold hydrolase [Stellaceae bacterium]
MPVAAIRGVDINYRVLGERGPWVALQPGGRRGLSGVERLAEKIAEAGHRVLIYDRRNCGASGVSFAGGDSENEIWAEDLRELLLRLDAAPAFIGGSSSGCRLALLLALRHPAAVRGLLLWRVTGGPYAAQRLVENYYTQFIDMARAGGMAAVCASEHFAELIRANPANRERLTAISVENFIAVMERWRRAFNEGADHPVIGLAPALAALDGDAGLHHPRQRSGASALGGAGGAPADAKQRISRGADRGPPRSRHRPRGLGEEGGPPGGDLNRLFTPRAAARLSALL